MKIGIDPGLSGAIAVLRGNELLTVIDIPVMAGPGTRKQVNPAEIDRILSSWTMPEVGTNLEIPVYLEQVSAMPGQGVSSMFGFGMTYGVIQGVVIALGMPLHLVTPQAWKKRAGLIGKPKDYARTLCQHLYPHVELGRKKDIGRAESILIARFGSDARAERD